MEELRVQSTSLEEIRRTAADFDVTFSDKERQLVNQGLSQQKEFGGVDMELELQLAATLDAIEKRGKSEINIRRLTDTVTRHRTAVRDWLNDPCYDLYDSDAFSLAEKKDLRALQRIALDAGSSNVQQVIYVMRLEQRLAKVELQLENLLKDAPDDTPAQSDKPRG